MKDLSEDELAKLESDALATQFELETVVADLEADRRVVASDLRELRLRLEEEVMRGARGLEGLVERLASLEVPELPLVAHRMRLAEVRADYARARMWLATSLRSDLERFTFELGHAIGLADEARGALTKLAEEPRVAPRDRAGRLARIKAVTSDLSGATKAPPSRVEDRRRLQPRQRFEVAIDLHSRSNFFTGVTENISEGGLFIASEERWPVGTLVELAFSLPSGALVRAKGAVRWSREPTATLSGGFGVGFEELTEEARDHIERFLQARAPIIREG